jgi:hypothetical protein
MDILEADGGRSAAITAMILWPDAGSFVIIAA